MSFQTFAFAFLVSYIGSVPPGTINVSVFQLSLLKKLRQAFFFALAASLVEFCYAGLTVQFHFVLSSNKYFEDYLKIITSITLISIGIYNLLPKNKEVFKKTQNKRLENSGFLRGTILGLLNPLTIPFWLTITISLEQDGLVDLSGINFWLYLIGISTGTLMLLLSILFFGSKFQKFSSNTFLVYKIPGLVLLSIGIYFFYTIFI